MLLWHQSAAAAAVALRAVAAAAAARTFVYVQCYQWLRSVQFDPICCDVLGMSLCFSQFIWLSVLSWILQRLCIGVIFLVRLYAKCSYVLQSGSSDLRSAVQERLVWRLMDAVRELLLFASEACRVLLSPACVCLYRIFCFYMIVLHGLFLCLRRSAVSFDRGYHYVS